jgi:integrase
MVNNETITERVKVGARMTIYTRGNRKIYYADFHHNGTHCRRSLKTTIKREAIRRAANLEQSLGDQHGVVTNPAVPATTSNMSVAAAAKEFTAFSRTEGRRRRTIVKQVGILTRFAEFAKKNGAHQLGDVDLRLIDAYRNERKATLSPKSMHNEAQLLKQFLGWCAERQMIASSPLAARKFRPPKYQPQEGPTLERINTILNAASAIRSPVLATLAFTGARSGEVSHLRVEDVDLTGNWLHYISRPGFETKSGNSWKVPIHERLRPVLEKALRNRVTGWLFTALPSPKYPDGDHHISTKHLNEDFVELLTKLKISAGKKKGGFTIHSLRRSFKTICVNAGIPREVVDAWQDHAHVRTPGDLYYKLADNDSQRFMKLVPFGRPN